MSSPLNALCLNSVGHNAEQSGLLLVNHSDSLSVLVMVLSIFNYGFEGWKFFRCIHTMAVHAGLTHF